MDNVKREFLLDGRAERLGVALGHGGTDHDLAFERPPRFPIGIIERQHVRHVVLLEELAVERPHSLGSDEDQRKLTPADAFGLKDFSCERADSGGI